MPTLAMQLMEYLPFRLWKGGEDETIRARNRWMILT
jgi:hypothetical protein